MRIHRYRLWLACVLIALLHTAAAHAQAFCELRDPVQQIYELFPEATSHRSVIRTIDEDTRRVTGERLPFKLHFNELGRHTLYIALKGNMPIGIVHVRSEAGRWGLVEIAWALTLDLEVIDFRFQRCRDTARSFVLRKEISSQIKGKNLAELERLFEKDGQTLSTKRFKLPRNKPDGAVELIQTTLRSALKTIVVTQHAWKDDLQLIRLMSAGLNAFDNAHLVQQIDHGELYEAMGDELNKMVGKGTGIDRKSVAILLIKDKRGETLGSAVWTSWSLDNETLGLWWTVSKESQLTDIKTDTNWPSAEMREAFEPLVGLSKSDLYKCSTTTELAAKEVILLTSGLFADVTEQETTDQD